MSKKFTIKDFILYSSPCTKCNDPNSIRVGITYDEKDNHNIDGSISPIISKDIFAVDLKISYNNSLHLSIDHKTNKFSTNNFILLKDYLKTHRIYLISRCDKCQCIFETETLSFNFDLGYILAVGMRFEQFSLKKDSNAYYFLSGFYEKTTTVTVWSNIDTPNRSYTILNLPLTPKYKFKDMNVLINKIKTYLLFS